MATAAARADSISMAWREKLLPRLRPLPVRGMAPVEPACECVLGDGVAVPLEEKDEESERVELLSGL